MNAVIAEVRRRKRVTFAEFMRLALYHPTAGYYTRRRRRAPGPAGTGGDFLTAPTASPLFTRTLGTLLADLSAALGQPLSLVELGAGEGAFLAGVLSVTGPVGAGAVRRAVAVEIGAWARRRLAARCPGVETAASLAERPRPSGPVVLFASELYDALPVHRVAMAAEGTRRVLREQFVEAGPGGRLRFVLDEPSTLAITAYLRDANVYLEDGQIAEVRPELRSAHANALAWCGHDAVALVVDYGHPARKLYDARSRRHGSLVGYRKHAVVRDVLRAPGEVDITAHVCFDDLEQAAADVGWERGELRPLGSFLALHGALRFLPAAAAAGGRLSPEDWAELAAAKRLLVPDGMASDIKVLAQGRGRSWQAYTKLATPPLLEA
jgi:NADH dehydrogenase [ubiquinone] 1 alpha subcomplex assembly factor 7